MKKRIAIEHVFFASFFIFIVCAMMPHKSDGQP